MKLWVPYGAMPNSPDTSPRTSPGPGWNSIQATLQQLRKDSRLRKCVLGTFLLLACTYAVLLFASGHTCSSSNSISSDDDGVDSAYCKLASWSRAVISSTSDSSRIVLPAGPSSNSTWEHDVLKELARRKNTAIDRIVFGIGANAASWTERAEYIKLWWKPGVTRGFVWVESDRDFDIWKEGDPPFKVSEDTSRFGYTHGMQARSALRMSRIVSESFRLELPNVDWFVMGDDDTLFFTDNLVKVLSKYDHTKFHYIGTNSEDTRQSERHHYGLAFGGGGFAISYPLAKALSEIQDECMERYTWLYGSDERVKACISELGVPLTVEPGFHQMDVHGDVSGFLAAHAVSPIVSLHHLDAIEPIFYGKPHWESVERLMKAASVDPASMFQQSICYDEKKRWSFSVSWGYVVEAYEGFLTPRELEIPATTFMSWAWRREFNAFTMDTRPLPEVCARPTRFFMVDAGTTEKGTERVGTTSYQRLKEFENEGCSAKTSPMDTAKSILVENEPLPDDWFQSPRRQCCTVTDINYYSINIRVGACGESESLVAGRKSAETKSKSRRLLR